MTSAAAIMVAVFAIFATLSHDRVKRLRGGHGVAVLVDATIVRRVLLPAGMALLGMRIWSRPGRRPPQLLTGNPRLTPPWLGSSQRDVTTLPRV